MSGAYVYLRNYDTESNMESFLTKLVKGLENQECCLNQIKEDILGL